ncbi:Origin of replication complex subunit 5 [Nymphaea thermarum]|nr:Origin of replication complex subunit 5 [Nymphaea thermarum]
MENSERPSRATRSSSFSPKTPSKTKASSPHTSACKDARKLFSLESLLADLPGRHRQITELCRLIGPPNTPMTPLFVYGAPFSGKTSVVLGVLRHLNRQFAYTNCRSCYNPRILFESMLDQISCRRRTAENDYSSGSRCDRASDFVALLRDALVHARSGGPKSDEQGRMVYLIFDNVESIRHWDEGLELISVLFSLSNTLKTPELGLVFISSVPMDDLHHENGFPELLTVFFTAYSEGEIHQILMKTQENPKLYSSFLDAVLKPFCRITRRINELSMALSPLFQKYCEPLDDLTVVPDEEMKRRLFSYIQPHLAMALNQVFELSMPDGCKTSQRRVKQKGTLRRHAGRDDGDGLDFHMSMSAKFLLISAFLASRNPATLDAALFDPAGGCDTRKRKRKSSEISITKKEIAAEEVLMKGPGTFPLERLLAIFQCITSVAENPEDTDTQGSVLTSDVLLQLSTLCNANFVYKGGSCPLDGSTRYRCMVDEELALKVARTVNFPLSNYLYKR